MPCQGSDVRPQRIHFVNLLPEVHRNSDVHHREISWVEEFELVLEVEHTRDVKAGEPVAWLRWDGHLSPTRVKFQGARVVTRNNTVLPTESLSLDENRKRPDTENVDSTDFLRRIRGRTDSSILK